MEKYKKFKDTFLGNSDFYPIKQSLIEMYKDKLPEDLFLFWHEIGIGWFNNGLFRLIEPEEYQFIVDNYIEDGKKYFEYTIPFMTTAFGDIFVWVKDIAQNKEYVIFINIRKCFWDIITSRIDLLFDLYFVSEELYKRYFDIKVSDYSILVDKLGIPKRDECYAYVPALVLGGKGSLKNIQIAKAIPYIDIICQSVGSIDMK